MLDKWWQDHPRVAHWWENGKKNTSNVCPDWFADKVGFSLGYSLFDLMSSTGNSIGFHTELSVIAKAGTTMEKLNTGIALANTWCFFGGVGGFIDATYQEFHNNTHLATGVIDGMSNWYEAKEKGVEDFLNGVHEWWKS